MITSRQSSARRGVTIAVVLTMILAMAPAVSGSVYAEASKKLSRPAKITVSKKTSNSFRIRQVRSRSGERNTDDSRFGTEAGGT